MPKTARDVMTPNAECVGENETLLDAARKMADRGYGSMPICGEDNRLKGMLTDRDIVVKALAKGSDPARPGRRARRGQAGHHRGRRLCRTPSRRWPSTRSAACR